MGITGRPACVRRFFFLKPWDVQKKIRLLLPLGGHAITIPMWKLWKERELLFFFAKTTSVQWKIAGSFLSHFLPEFNTCHFLSWKRKKRRLIIEFLERGKEEDNPATFHFPSSFQHATTQKKNLVCEKEEEASRAFPSTKELILSKRDYKLLSPPLLFPFAPNKGGGIFFASLRIFYSATTAAMFCDGVKW